MGQTANIGCPMLGLFGEEDVNPTPEDVANAAVFLASSKARMINGINLEVDGGVTIPIAIGVDWETYTRVKKETTTRRKKKRK